MPRSGSYYYPGSNQAPTTATVVTTAVNIGSPYVVQMNSTPVMQGDGASVYITPMASNGSIYLYVSGGIGNRLVISAAATGSTTIPWNFNNNLFANIALYYKVPISSKTGSFSPVTTDSGTRFVYSAAGVATASLPAPAAGLTFVFLHNPAAGTLVLSCSTGKIASPGTLTATRTTSTQYSMMTLTAFDTSAYWVESFTGTWA
jgi:hypothetical protein